MVRVRSPVTVQQEAICRKAVVVRTSRRSGDRKGEIEKAWFEDPLGSEERNPFTFELEPLLQQFSWQHVSVDCLLFPQPVESTKSDLLLETLHCDAQERQSSRWNRSMSVSRVSVWVRRQAEFWFANIPFSQIA